MLHFNSNFSSHQSVVIEDSRSASLHQMNDDAEVALADGVPQRAAALPVGRVDVQRTLQGTF